MSSKRLHNGGIFMKKIKTIRNVLFVIMGFLVVTVVCLAFGNANHTAVEGVRASLSTVESLAETTAADNGMSAKAIGAGIVVGLAALGGTIGMGMAISKSSEGISRQPQAEGKIRTTLMLGLVFIETLVIYALIVAILLIFVL